MFSFHKPKVYRSSTGCCICRAKSSSSRFTDSKKYEDDFMECFQLQEHRSGEICNACVLLVKRYKKLPVGSDRNWQHVVDYRAGPGTKSLAKFKSKNKKVKTGDGARKSEKLVKKSGREQSSREDRQDEAPGDDFMLVTNMPMGHAPSPTPSDESAKHSPIKKKRNRFASLHEKAIKQRSQIPVSGFLDLNFWKTEEVCCGTIFTGQDHLNIAVLDLRFLKPCARHGAPDAGKKPASPEPAGAPGASSGGKLAKTFSDASSDSGYDELSNPGVGEGAPPHPTASVIKHAGRCRQDAEVATN
ncbi:SIN3-HDAC complex-associated factor [Bacillus rossius redtenbacheri]|uniref:SIN3-HDAC complex-associated factor n=1 Tax=Bacillus rossius redtenbacheri TaxID=93214 RepID=UPI002FDCF6E8